VGFQERPLELGGVQANARLVTREVVAQFVARSDEFMHERLAAGDPAGDQEEGGPRLVPLQLRQDQGRPSRVGPVVDRQRDQRHLEVHPVEAAGTEPGEAVDQPVGRSPEGCAGAAGCQSGDGKSKLPTPFRHTPRSVSA
jgi:hypothetical protein